MRVIVLNQSTPLRQVVEFMTERGVDVEIVAETATANNLESLVGQTQPDYLFLLQRDYNDLSNVVTELVASKPMLGVAVVSEEGQEVQLQVNQTAVSQGLTGHELQSDGSNAASAGPAVPHSPDKHPPHETSVQRAPTTANHQNAVAALSPAWRTYTLSDFIYLMTEDQPKNAPSGGITDVPHNEPQP